MSSALEPRTDRRSPLAGERDLYEILQVHRSAEPEVIEAAYRRLARKYHPDVNSSPEAAFRMKELSAAYEVLRDPARRAKYDRQCAQVVTTAGTSPKTPQAQPDINVNRELSLSGKCGQSVRSALTTGCAWAPPRQPWRS